MEKEEKICMLALSRLFGYESAAGLALVKQFGSAVEVFKTPHKHLEAVCGREFAARIQRREVECAEKTLDEVLGDGADFITIGEPGYPPLLLECPDPPLGLFIKGKPSFDRPCIAIVGTRDISSYGKLWCSKIVEAMAGCPVKPLIVSGLAIGVDITAHTAALEHGLPTVAVMATGTEKVYPFRHGYAAELIASSPGSGLVTDFPPGTVPQALNFLRRNRIIAGMCPATILVESKIKGGGMNTARLAFGYARDVFALPGRIDDIRSQGCNLLIREGVAEAISDIPELIAKLGLGAVKKPKSKDLEAIVRGVYGDSMPPEDVEELVRMALAIRSHRDISLEDLAFTVDMDYGEAATAAGILESDGIIEIGLLRNCSINVKYC